MDNSTENDASRMASGVYFCVLEFSTISDVQGYIRLVTHKMLMVK
jgi:hypothetical protein